MCRRHVKQAAPWCSASVYYVTWLQVTQSRNNQILSNLDCGILPNLAYLCANWHTCTCFFESFVCASFFSNKLTYLSAQKKGLILQESGWMSQTKSQRIETGTRPMDGTQWLPLGKTWWSTDSMAGLRMFPRCRSVFLRALNGATGRSSFLWMLHNWSQNITDGTSGILTVSHTCSILSQWFQLLKRPHIRIIRNQPSSIFFKLDSWASTLQAFFSTCEHPQQQIFKTKCPFISPSWVAKRAVSFIMFDIFLHHRNTLARLCRPCASHQRYA